MEGMVILLVVGGIALGIYFWFNSNRIKNGEKLRERIQEIYRDLEITPTRENFNNSMTEGIVFDSTQNKFFLFTRKGFEFDYNVSSLKPNQIIETKIIENGETVTTSSKASVIGGAAIGSFLAGGFGMVVGGLSGKKFTDKKVSELNLEMIVDDQLNPIQRTQFMYNANGLKQNSDEYRKEYEKAYYWLKLTEVAIQQNKRGVL